MAWNLFCFGTLPRRSVLFQKYKQFFWSQILILKFKNKRLCYQFELIFLQHRYAGGQPLTFELTRLHKELSVNDNISLLYHWSGQEFQNVFNVGWSILVLPR